MITEHGEELGLPEVLGLAEVAKVLGVRKSNIDGIRDLPEPVYDLESGRSWLADEIYAFAEIYNRRREARLARAAA